MPIQKPKRAKVKVHVRIRPSSKEEIEREDAKLELKIDDGDNVENNKPKVATLHLTTPKTEGDDVEFVEVLGFKVPKSTPQRKKKYTAFRSIARPTDDNNAVFTSTVTPMITRTLAGTTSCYLAYGHTGSGKTHTVLGDDSTSSCRGMYHLATAALFSKLNAISSELQVAIRFTEIYNGEMYDLLNNNSRVYVREDDEGRIKYRGETKTDDNGLVTVSYATASRAKTHEELMEIVSAGMNARKVGNSNVHRQSSRSHAILEFEVVTEEIINRREEIELNKALMARISCERDRLEVKIHGRQYFKVEGKWVQRKDYEPATQDEVDLLSTMKREMADAEKKVVEAKARLKNAMEDRPALAVGGTMVFVDLAGSEHAGKVTDGIQKTDAEQRECREINLSLSALRSCFGAMAQGYRSSSCFRQSTLTLALRDHFRSEAAHTVMISTISPSALHTDKTIHTLQYAVLMLKL